MAELLATHSPQEHRTICLPIAEETYRRIVGDPVAYRRAIGDSFRRMPELFPAGFAQGYQLKDDRMSVKQGFLIRRIVLKDGTAYGVRPSFLLPSITARTEDVEDSRRPGRREARRRAVERTFAWLSKCRGLLVRYGEHAANYLGWIQLGCALLRDFGPGGLGHLDSTRRHALNAQKCPFRWGTGQVFVTEAKRRRLRRHREIHVICDEAGSHTGHEVIEYLREHAGRIEVHLLPSYSPDYNPIERVWWHLHEGITRNRRCRDPGELPERVFARLDRGNPSRSGVRSTRRPGPPD